MKLTMASHKGIEERIGLHAYGLKTLEERITRHRRLIGTVRPAETQMEMLAQSLGCYPMPILDRIDSLEKKLKDLIEYLGVEDGYIPPTPGRTLYRKASKSKKEEQV